MKDLQFTLYEVFGYLLPGAVIAGGIGVLFWAVFFPVAAVEIDIKSTEVWGLFLALAYLAGHVGQGVGNAVARRSVSPEDHAADAVLPAPLVAACKLKAKELTGADPDALPARWLYRLCDDSVLRSGKLGEREVYVYREGFYRGASVGMAVLAVGLLAMAIRLLADGGTSPGRAFATIPAVWLVAGGAAAGWWAITLRLTRPRAGTALAVTALGLLGGAGWSVHAGDWNATVRVGSLEFTAARLLFLTALAAVGTRFLWQRFWRFAEYRVTQAYLGFLTLTGETKPDAAKAGG
jgi:hypothetical protein